MIEFEEKVIESIIKDFEIDLGNSNFMDTIRTCIPLFGEKIINEWKEKVKIYPNKLAIKNIEKSLETIDNTQVMLFIQRDNPTLLYEYIVNLQKNIYLIILALNSQYFPTFKWMYNSFETFNIKPRNIEQRFRHVFECSPNEAFETVSSIITETIVLINKIYPEINTDIVKDRMNTSRKVYDSPIIL